MIYVASTYGKNQGEVGKTKRKGVRLIRVQHWLYLARFIEGDFGNPTRTEGVWAYGIILACVN